MWRLTYDVTFVLFLFFFLEILFLFHLCCDLKQTQTLFSFTAYLHSLKVSNPNHLTQHNQLGQASILKNKESSTERLVAILLWKQDLQSARSFSSLLKLKQQMASTGSPIFPTLFSTIFSSFYPSNPSHKPASYPTVGDLFGPPSPISTSPPLTITQMTFLQKSHILGPPREWIS